MHMHVCVGGGAALAHTFFQICLFFYLLYKQYLICMDIFIYIVYFVTVALIFLKVTVSFFYVVIITDVDILLYTSK